MTTVLRNPNGLPFLAGRNFTVILSPVWRPFGPVLPIPLCARAVAEPSVITHSVVEPSGFLTEILSDPGGFTNFTCSTDPDISISFFMSLPPESSTGGTESQIVLIPKYKDPPPFLRMSLAARSEVAALALIQRRNGRKLVGSKTFLRNAVRDRIRQTSHDVMKRRLVAMI